MTGRQALRRLAGVACLILAFAAGAVGLTKGFIGTRHEADVEAPIALALAAALAVSGLWLLAAGGRTPDRQKQPRRPRVSSLCALNASFRSDTRKTARNGVPPATAGGNECHLKR